MLQGHPGAVGANAGLVAVCIGLGKGHMEDTGPHGWAGGSLPGPRSEPGRGCVSLFKTLWGLGVFTEASVFVLHILILVLSTQQNTHVQHETLGFSSKN